jgi:hypothetical protein
VSEGPPLRRVTSAGTGPEAEMIAGLLRDAGIPSVIRRTPGADVPDFLAGGPRELLVRDADLAAARELVESHFGLR